MPTLGEDSYRAAFATLHPPRARGVRQLVQVFNHGARDWTEEVAWGRPTITDRDGTILLANVSALVLRILVDDPVDRDLINGVGQSVMSHSNDWMSLLYAWVAALSGQDMHLTSPFSGWHRQPGIGMTHPWVADTERPLTYHYVNPPLHYVLESEQFGLNRREWKRAVASANVGLEVPEEHRLLQDSWAAFRRDDHRKAVLDAATAVELTVTRELRRRLSGTNDPLVVDELLRQIRQARNRQNLARKLGAHLPDNLSDKVSRLRNEVAHQNRLPGKKETSEAIRVASEVVKHHVELPHPKSQLQSKRLGSSPAAQFCERNTAAPDCESNHP